MQNILDFLQGASNSAASNVSAPVDGINWLLRKAGLPVSEKPFLGSDWMADKGLTAQPKNRNIGLLGEAIGGVLPIVAAAKAPQIAGGLNQAMDNLAAPQTLGKEAGAVLLHASPYKFDKFAAGKLGSGEGNASFGHGTYLAESPEVSGVGGKYFEQFKRHPAAAETGGPFSYKVDVPDEHIGKMLDWDKTLGQQSPDVRKAITKLAQSNPEVMDAIKKGGMSDMKGNLLYASLQDLKVGDAKRAAVMAGENPANWSRDDIARLASGNDAWASNQLHEIGIPGIRYLDQGSRTQGAGTSNFVVFPGNEGLLSILERNGQALK